jgi:RHS repeat-associated protein
MEMRETINPTVFDWNEMVGTATNQTTINAVNGVAGDYNGDGLGDFLAIIEEDSRIYERLYINNDGNLSFSGWSKELPGWALITAQLQNVLDFNGDGKTDIFEKETVYANGYRQVIGLSDGLSFSYLNGNNYNEDFKSAVGDFDGDGIDDVFLLYSNGSAKLLRYNNGNIEQVEFNENGAVNSAHFSSTDKLYPGDYNADGHLDIGYKDENNLFQSFTFAFDPNTLVKIILPSISIGRDASIGDFNGDGLTDVIDISADGYNINFNTHGYDINFNTLEETANKVPGSLSIPSKEHGQMFSYGASTFGCNEVVLNFSPTVRDINMDGKADIIYTVGKGYEFFKRTNSDPLTEDEIATINNWGLEGIEISSYGATWIAPKHFFIAFGKGDGTFVFKHVETYTGYDYGPSDDIKIMDLNGDGILDVYVKIEDTYRARAVNVRFHNYQLKTATDGLNNTVQFDYKSLNDPTDPFFYHFQSGPDYYPLKTLKGSLIAVKQITHSNGNSNDIVERYSYGDGQIHVLGKGFLGFERITKENLTLGIYDRFSYSINRDYYTSELTYTQKNVPNNTGKTIDYQILEGSFVPLGGKRYIYKLDKKTVNDYINSNTTTIDYSFDNVGNLLTETITTDDAIVTTTNTYVTRGSHCPNRIENTTTTYTRGAESKSRSKSYLWDNNGNLTKETIDPGDANELVTDYSDYDDFGNPQTVTATAKNYPPRTGTFTYENGRMVKTSTNSLNQETTYKNNLDWGTIGSVTDHKNRTTSYSYDDWGRQTGINYPGDKIKVTAATLWAKGDGPAGAIFYTQKETSGSAPEKIWFDATGKKLRIETTGFSGQVYIDTEYDTKGRVHGVSEPYYAGGDKKLKINGYDEYNRVITQTLPTNEVISTTYDPNQITITGPNTDITKVMNSLGEVISTTDNQGNESVSYEYYANGLLKSSTPSTGVAVTMNYDTQGNRIEMVDPDAGTITSKYNGFGDLIWQEDNKGNRTTNIFDAHGRLDYIERNNASTIDYVYDGDSRLSSISDGIHTIGYEYDEYDRITKTTENIDSRDFVFEVVLDDYGRVEDEIYPSGYTITNNYNSAGILTDIVDQNDVPIWKADVVNALGQFEQVTKGNGVSTVYGYDAHHRPTSITAGSIVNFSYEFDPVKGNLNWRKDELHGPREDFDYDELNRLKWAKYDGQETNYLDIAYEANGNIKSKTDAASNYIYDATQPHAVSTLEGYKNIPDQNPQNIIYNHFNKVSKITEGDYEMNFTYGVDEFRKKTELYNASVLTKTKYIFGDYEVELDAANNERKIHYIAGGDGLAAIYIEEPGTAPGEGDLYYAYADHLGSLVALQDKNGNIQRQSFDPWGRRRDVDDWGCDNPERINIVDIGYTGHEHLNEFGIINMTGRLYDPVLGRMFSPDIHIQDPSNSQSFNMYTYCLNNPLKYTDPTGYSWWSDLWSWVGNTGVNFTNWLDENNIHFQVGINYSPGGGYMPYGGVSPNGGNTYYNGGYNTSTGNWGYGTGEAGFSNFYYPNESFSPEAIVNHQLNESIAMYSSSFFEDIDYLSLNNTFNNTSILQQGIEAEYFNLVGKGRYADAIYSIIDHYKLDRNVQGRYRVMFTDDPQSLLITTEGAIGQRQVINIRTGFFRLNHFGTAVRFIDHELTHVYQKTILRMTDHNEREFLAYHRTFFAKHIPEAHPIMLNEWYHKPINYYFKMSDYSKFLYIGEYYDFIFYNKK